MSKFKVGDKVRVVMSDEHFGLYEDSVHTVTSVHPMGNIELQGTSVIQWSPDRFELVHDDPVLTPEEVFEHLREGTKLQYKQEASPTGWRDCSNPQFANILNRVWRIKPEPEVIVLNGEKYQEIME